MPWWRCRTMRIEHKFKSIRMANVNQQIKTEIRLWARAIGFYADGSDAGFYVVATHHDNDTENYCAFSERSGECVCTCMYRNAKLENSPYGREYLFSFEDEEGNTIYLESLPE